ncbi:DNA translocase FtsK [Peptococcaceae bacterium CEB3]|nr:DNA translocase FtsK [Peptococcaceae bacterium CEB3]
MTKRRRNSGSIGKRVLGTVALLLSLLGFLGTFGVTRQGRAVAAYFTGLFGHLAWIGPYLLFAIALYLWFSPGKPRRGNRRVRSSDRDPRMKKSGQRRERETRGLSEGDGPLLAHGGTLFSGSPASDKRAAKARGTGGNRGAKKRAKQEQATHNGTDGQPRARDYTGTDSNPQARDYNETEGRPRLREGFWARRKGKLQPGRERQGKTAGDERGNSVGLPLPPTKLTTLKGFNRYFREDWQEFAPPGPENYPELGRNFSTYFGEGEAAGKSTPVIKSLHGLRAYFREVQNETAAEMQADPGIHPETAAGTYRETPVAIHRETRPALRRETPVETHRETSAATHRGTLPTTPPTISATIQAETLRDSQFGTASKILTTNKEEIPPEKHPDPLPRVSDPVRMTVLSGDGAGMVSAGAGMSVREQPDDEGACDQPAADELSLVASATAEGMPDPDAQLFLAAGRLFLKSGMASVTFLQRRLQLDYARAAEIMDKLEEGGIVGPYEGSKPRQVLVDSAEFEERYGHSLNAFSD